MFRSPLRLPSCRKPPRFAVALLVACLACWNATDPATARESAGEAQLTFGVRMAQQGLWNEALFRFHQAEKADPANARIRNNLAVAYEATGDFEKALAYYKQALEATPNDRTMRGNYARFVEFYQAYKGGKAAKTAAGKEGAAKPALDPNQPLVPTGAPASAPAPPIEIPENSPLPPPL